MFTLKKPANLRDFFLSRKIKEFLWNFNGKFEELKKNSLIIMFLFLQAVGNPPIGQIENYVFKICCKYIIYSIYSRLYFICLSKILNMQYTFFIRNI